MSDDRTDAPPPEALAAVFRAAGWHYTPDLDTFTYFERKTWLAAARALDAFAKAAVERERENTNQLFIAIEKIRSDIFYWMIRNHHRGERSYSVLGEAKEALTVAIKAYEEQP
jgi:hypothetical protein